MSPDEHSFYTKIISKIDEPEVMSLEDKIAKVRESVQAMHEKAESERLS
jgi:hypothetical protein